MSIMEAAETVVGWMGGEHDKAALEQLSKRRERTFTYVNERIFLNKMLLKNHFSSRFKFDTLKSLMCITLCEIEVDNMD